MYILPGLILIGIIATNRIKRKLGEEYGLREKKHEQIKDILIRTVKIYLFVMALIFLGTGFKPIIDMYISKISHLALYWINITSAILDNATLSAAEISPSMSITQIKSAILGLIIAGGMLIPGNIPNIIAASKLNIKSKEWAKIGIPFGLFLMTVYFFAILIFL